MDVVAATASTTPTGEPCLRVTITGGEPEVLLRRVLRRLDGRAIGIAHDVGRDDERAAVVAFLQSRDLFAAAELIRTGNHREGGS